MEKEALLSLVRSTYYYYYTRMRRPAGAIVREGGRETITANYYGNPRVKTLPGLTNLQMAVPTTHARERQIS